MNIISFDLTDGNLFDNTVINGTALDEEIYGDLGNDTLRGYGGNDVLYGNAGNDYLWGGSGNDQIRGESGNDTIHGGSGIDEVYASGNFNYILSNTQLIGDGVDTLLSIEKATLFSGAGNNSINASAFTGSTVLHGLDGHDTIRGGGGDDTLWGGNGSDKLYGNNGSDQLFGGSGNDTLFGGLGDDTLNGGIGYDVLYENNNVSYNLSNTQLESYIPFNNTIGVDVLQSIEKAILVGGAITNIMDAREFTGETTLLGLGGEDYLYGGSNADYIDGGNGNDHLSGRMGDDTINGGNGNDLIFGGAGNNIINGGSGFDIYSAEGDFDYVLTDTKLTGNGTHTLSSIERVLLRGGDNNNIINAYSFSGEAHLYGEGGNDLLFANNGNNRVEGGEGNDQLYGFSGDDMLSGGEGDDTLFGGLGFDSVYESAESSFIISNTQLLGNGLDSLYDIEQISIDVGNGDHVINASAFGGSTWLAGDSGNLLVQGGYSTDTVYGGDGNDTIYGNNGNDNLSGAQGNDVLVGGAGNDSLNGAHDIWDNGTGDRDILTSGSILDSDLFILGYGYGNSKFYLDGSSQSGNNSFARITDFDIYGTGTQDRIQLHGTANQYSLGLTLVSGEIGVGIHHNNDLIALVQGAGVSASSLNLNNSSQFVYV